MLPNKGMQATAYSLRLAMLSSGFPSRLMPGVRLMGETVRRSQLCTLDFMKQARSLDFEEAASRALCSGSREFTAPSA